MTSVSHYLFDDPCTSVSFSARARSSTVPSLENSINFCGAASVLLDTLYVANGILRPVSEICEPANISVEHRYVALRSNRLVF